MTPIQDSAVAMAYRAVARYIFFASLLVLFGLGTMTTYAQITLPATGNISTVAGNGSAGYSGDAGQATHAEINNAEGIAVDINGDIYLADSANNRIRKVTATTGVISTIAGNGNAGFSGDGGPATSATFNCPTSVAVDGYGNVYVADLNNQRIRKIVASTGIITTVAGNGNDGYNGDAQPAIQAELNNPSSVAVDSFGNLYIADLNNQRIRKITVKTGIISTIAGNGTVGYYGDGGSAANSELDAPSSVAVYGNGDVYIADTLNNCIRKVAATGTITTVAGSGIGGYSGDGGLATSARLQRPNAVAVEPTGDVYFTDQDNTRIRKVTLSSGIITAVAGNGIAGYSGDGGSATSASIHAGGIATDELLNLYMADAGNNRVRAVGGPHIVQRTTSGLKNAPTNAQSGSVTENSTSSTQNGSTGVKAAFSSVVKPAFGDSYCNVPYPPKADTGLPSGSGYWYLTYYFTNESVNGVGGCGTPYVSTTVTWMTLYPSTTSCSPNPEPFGTLITCTEEYFAVPNPGPTRSGDITVDFGPSVGKEAVAVTQYGPWETLQVALLGASGGGMVTSSPSGINCPGTCSIGVQFETQINLSATPNPGYQFARWSGACAGSAPTCGIYMSGAQSATATFSALPASFTLSSTAVSNLPLGHARTSQITVWAQNGFTGTVALSVSGGLPVGVTANFSPAFISGSGTSTLTLTAAYSNSTHIGTSNVTVTGSNGTLASSTNILLTTEPLQYKGYCGVPQ